MGPNDFNTIQSAFTAGELSPQLFGRVDLQKYTLGAARLRNMFVDIRGGASSRPGTQFLAEVHDSAYPVLLLPFSFSTIQTYMLEFGQNTMRAFTNGGLITNTDGTPYVLATPWAAADLPRLRYAQSADVMTLCHPSYPPYDLGRTGDTSWTLTKVVFGTTAPSPNGAVYAVATVAGGTTTYRYVVTAQVGSEESLPSSPGVSPNAAVMSVNGNEYITVTWQPVSGAALYNIYRQEEVPNGAPDPGSLYGLVGSTTSTTYQDRNGLPDFAQTPGILQNPFEGGAITGITVTAGGTGYNSSTTIVVTDSTGQGFSGFPIIASGIITGVVIQSGGWGYTAPTITFSDPGGGTGATTTTTVAPTPTDLPVYSGGGGGDGGSGGGNDVGAGPDPSSGGGDPNSNGGSSDS